MSDFNMCKAVIVLLAMPGCGACEEFKPRFERMVDHFAKHGAPLVWYAPETTVSPGQIPVIIADATSPDPSIQGFCDAYGISAMPTTVLVTRGRAPDPHEGSIPDEELHALLTRAVIAGR